MANKYCAVGKKIMDILTIDGNDYIVLSDGTVLMCESYSNEGWLGVLISENTCSV